MTFIRSFISTINAQIEANICEKNTCFYSLTQSQFLKNNKRQPIEPGPVDARAIIPSDIYPIQIYHRLLGMDSEPTERTGDGYLYNVTFRLRLFGVVVLNKISADCFAGHDDVALAAWSAFPKSGRWAATGMKAIRVRVGDVNSNSRAIIAAEYAGLDEGRVNGMTVAAFSIDYNLTGRMCADLCDVGDIVLDP